MRKAPILALLGPLVLIGAAYPDLDKSESYGTESPGEPVAGPTHYRPCRPGAGDDRCIQLYERGVRTAYAQWLRERDADPEPTRLAMGGPVERPARPRRQQRPAQVRCMDQEASPRHRHDREERDVPTGAAEDRDAGYGAEARGM